MSFTDLSYTPLTDSFFEITKFNRRDPGDVCNNWIIDLGNPISQIDFEMLIENRLFMCDRIVIFNPNKEFLIKAFKVYCNGAVIIAQRSLCLYGWTLSGFANIEKNVDLKTSKRDRNIIIKDMRIILCDMFRNDNIRKIMEKT